MATAPHAVLPGSEPTYKLGSVQALCMHVACGRHMLPQHLKYIFRSAHLYNHRLVSIKHAAGVLYTFWLQALRHRVRLLKWYGRLLKGYV